MKYKYINQKGMASIMFAIIMSIILCLLAIGFATLSKNDQRQTLDKTLSSQASYAAESAINKVKGAYKNDSSFADNTNCNGVGDSNTFITNLRTDLSSVISGVDITCLTWDSSLPTLQKSNLDTNGWVVPIVPASGSVNKIVITWSPVENPTASPPTISSTAKLTLDAGKIPTIRLAAAEGNDITNASVVYINPGLSTEAGMGSLSFGNASGSISNSKCQDAGSGYTCSIILDIGANWSSAMLALYSLNGSSNVWVQALDSVSGSPSVLTKAQAKIDASARSQDVSKRIVAYVPVYKSTWHPSYVISADSLCKNYKLDGSTNAVAGPVNSTVCP